MSIRPIRHYVGLQYGYENAFEIGMQLEKGITQVILLDGRLLPSNISSSIQSVILPSVFFSPSEIYSSLSDQVDILFSIESGLIMPWHKSTWEYLADVISFSQIKLKDVLDGSFRELVYKEAKKHGYELSNEEFDVFQEQCMTIIKHVKSVFEIDRESVFISLCGMSQRRLSEMEILNTMDGINLERIGVFSPLSIYKDGEICTTPILLRGTQTFIKERVMNKDTNIGWLDLTLIRQAKERGIHRFILTDLSLLFGIDEIYIKTGWKGCNDGAILLSNTPVYEILNGISGNVATFKSISDLSVGAMDVVTFIEENIGIRFDMIGLDSKHLLKR